MSELQEGDRWIHDDAVERWQEQERIGRGAARLYFEFFGCIRPPTANLRHPAMRRGWESEREIIRAEQRESEARGA